MQDLKVSLVWVADHLDALDGATTRVEPIPLTRDDSYFEAFASARAARPPVEWVVPWHHPRGDNFWNYYLEREDLNIVSAVEAWTGLVPLRRSAGDSVAAEHSGVGTRISRYVFPFAVGAEITLRIRTKEPWPLEHAVEQLLEVRREGRFVRSGDGQADAPRRLDALGEYGIAGLRQDLFRGQKPPPLVPLSPFSVVTIIQAGGEKLGDSVAEGGVVHRALQGLARWSPTWQADQLVPLADSRCLARSAAPASHLVACSARGRVVWFPVHAADREAQGTLGCYHRNLVAAALQTEAQGRLVRWLDPRLAQWGDLPGVLQTWGRRAAGSLARLYVGKSTYRSGSCRAHLIDSGSVEALNRVRQRIGMPAV